MSSTEQLVFKLKDLLANNSKLTVSQIIARGMEFAEKLTLKEGETKKEVVSDALAQVADNQTLDILTNKELVQNIMDTIILATKGKFDINKAVPIVAQKASKEIKNKCMPLLGNLSKCMLPLLSHKKA